MGNKDRYYMDSFSGAKFIFCQHSRKAQINFNILEHDSFIYLYIFVSLYVSGHLYKAYFCP